MKKNLLALALIASTGSAQAAIISFTDSIGLTPTNWTETLSLQQFDGTLGTLNSITFRYGGVVSSIFRVESLDATPSVITATSSAELTFDWSVLAEQTLLASNSATQNLGAFDGAIDFGGTSGAVIGPVVGTEERIQLLSNFGAFMGAGLFDIDVSAVGRSSVSGAGNLISQISTQASSFVEVTYDYSTNTVPEPASLALLGLGLLGIAVVRRKSVPLN